VEVDSGVGKQANLSTWQIRLANGIHNLICVSSVNSTTFAKFFGKFIKFSISKNFNFFLKILLMGYKKQHFHEIELFVEVSLWHIYFKKIRCISTLYPYLHFNLLGS
jgi:hypothetical protein